MMLEEAKILGWKRMMMYFNNSLWKTKTYPSFNAIKFIRDQMPGVGFQKRAELSFLRDWKQYEGRLFKQSCSVACIYKHMEHEAVEKLSSGTLL